MQPLSCTPKVMYGTHSKESLKKQGAPYVYVYGIYIYVYTKFRPKNCNYSKSRQVLMFPHLFWPCPPM